MRASTAPNEHHYSRIVYRIFSSLGIFVIFISTLSFHLYKVGYVFTFLFLFFIYFDFFLVYIGEYVFFKIFLAGRKKEAIIYVFRPRVIVSIFLTFTLCVRFDFYVCCVCKYNSLYIEKTEENRCAESADV